MANPLMSGSDPLIISENVQELVRQGYDHAQAIRLALEKVKADEADALERGNLEHEPSIDHPVHGPAGEMGALPDGMTPRDIAMETRGPISDVTTNYQTMTKQMMDRALAADKLPAKKRNAPFRTK